MLKLIILILSIAFSVNAQCTYTPKVNVHIPNAFSPNGDGINDVLYVLGESCCPFTFLIFNRWGEKVFETRNTSNGWDGTYKGKPLNMDVFAYYVAVNCDNKTHIYEGSITLIK